MWALIEDNTIVRTFNRPKPITINNIQHPRTIFTLWSEEELNTIGIYSITKNITSFDSKTEKQSSSSRVFENNTVVESNVVVDRDLDEIKQSLNTDVSNTLSSYLSQSDWYYIRKLDKEIAIPSAIQTWRNELRANAASMEAAVKAAEEAAKAQAAEEAAAAEAAEAAEEEVVVEED